MKVTLSLDFLNFHEYRSHFAPLDEAIRPSRLIDSKVGIEFLVPLSSSTSLVKRSIHPIILTPMHFGYHTR